MLVAFVQQNGFDSFLRDLKVRLDYKFSQLNSSALSPLKCGESFSVGLLALEILMCKLHHTSTTGPTIITNDKIKALIETTGS